MLILDHDGSTDDAVPGPGHLVLVVRHLHHGAPRAVPRPADVHHEPRGVGVAAPPPPPPSLAAVAQINTVICVHSFVSTCQMTILIDFTSLQTLTFAAREEERFVFDEGDNEDRQNN